MNSSLGSDHLLVLTTIYETCEQEATFIPKWKFAKADWSAFRDKSRQYITVPSVVTNDVDSFSENLTLAIQMAAETTVPRTKPKRIHKFRPFPYWNDEIKTVLRARNRLRNKANRSKNIDDIIEYKRRKAIAQRVLKDTARLLQYA